MTGTGVVMVTTAPLSRALWDALVNAITNFKASHPEIASVNFSYTELSAQ